LRRSLDQGFRGIKIKGGDGDLANDERVVKAVRGLIGPDIALMLDFNQSLDPAEATRRIARLAPYDLHWIEEPVAQENLQGHAQVRATSAISHQSGEDWWFSRGFGEAVGGANGANRLSGNAVTEALAFGRRAGRSAAAFAANTKLQPWEDRTVPAVDCPKTINPAAELVALQATMNNDVGPFRTRAGLERALSHIESLRDNGAIEIGRESHP